MSEKITLIMPAYNAAPYIERSVGSVLEQRHRDLELIVVDDGSTDDTAARLAAMAAADPRLRPMTVPNGGPAMARNRALDAMSPDTDYVMFIDADDLLLPDAADYALSAAREGADLVVFGFSILEIGGGKRDYCQPQQRLDRQSLGAALPRLYRANLLNQVWGKLFRAELIVREGLRFPDYRWGEDRLFLFRAMAVAERLTVLPECKYQYMMHEGESLITRYYDRKFEVCLEVDRQMEALADQLGVTVDADLRYMFLKSVFSCLTTLYAPNCTLTAAEKRAAAAAVMAEPRVRERSRGASGGLPVAALGAVLRSGSPSLALAAFRTVALVGEKAPALFMSLKHR